MTDGGEKRYRDGTCNGRADRADQGARAVGGSTGGGVKIMSEDHLLLKAVVKELLLHENVINLYTFLTIDNGVERSS